MTIITQKILVYLKNIYHLVHTLTDAVLLVLSICVVMRKEITFKERFQKNLYINITLRVFRYQFV